MTLFRRRLFALFLLTFAVCSFLLADTFCTDTPNGGFLFGGPAPVFAVFFLSLVSFLLFALFAGNRRAALRRISEVFLRIFAVLLATALSFLFCWLGCYRPMSEATVLDGKRATARAEILSVDSLGSYYSVFTVGLTALDGKDTDMRVRLELDFPCGFRTGDIITFDGVFRLPELSDKRRLASDGIFLTAECAEISEISMTGHRYAGIISRIRSLGDPAEKILKGSMSEDGSALASALLLGRKDGLSYRFRRNLNRLGISHLLALSGMHLTVLCSGISYFLELLRFKKKARLVTVMIFAAFYAVFTGMSPSIVRAAVMLILSDAAFLLGRKYDPLTALAISVTFILICSPCSACDVGLCLSFLAMLSIVTVSSGVSFETERRITALNIPRIPAAVISFVLYSLTVSLFVMIFSLPVMWRCFGEFSLVTAPMTLIFSKLTEAMIFLGIFVLLTSFVPGAETLFAMLGDRTAGLIMRMSELFAGIPGVVVALDYPFSGLIAAALAVSVAVILVFLKKRRGSCILIAGFTAAVAFSVCLLCYNTGSAGRVRAVYENHGTNDVIVFSSENRTLVCDITGGGYSPLKNGIEESGDLRFSEIDVYMLTGFHGRNAATLAKLSDSYILREIWVPAPGDETEREICDAVISVACEKGIDTRIYEVGERLSFGRLEISMCGLRHLARSEQPTFAIRFSNGGAGLTYFASAYWEGNIEETEALAAGAQGVIVGRHGPAVKEEYPGEDYISASDEKKLMILG